MAEKKKRLTIAELAERHSQILTELHQQHELVKSLMDELDKMQNALKILHQQAEVEAEAREQTTEILRDTLRHLWVLATHTGAVTIADKLAILGHTLNEYLPENEEATA